MANQPIKKAHSLTGRITYGLMLQAFKAVKRNRGAAGIDKVSIQMFAANLDQNLHALMRDLKEGTFVPLPLRRHYIPKSPTEDRALGIPAVRDRVGQEVLRRLLQPIFEPTFHDASYGFRPERNCHQAIQAVLNFHESGFQDVVDADIAGFFDNLPFKVIMAAVAQRVADGNILRLIEKFLRSGVMEDGAFKPTSVGTPQGGVLSPLLANIVLNHLDWQLDNRGWRFVRYADDFVLVCQTPAKAEEALAHVRLILRDLGLTLSEQKTKITTYAKGYSFLGFWLCSRSRRMRPKSVQKFKDKIRELTCRKLNLEAKVIVQLNQVIRGTAQYFATPFFTARESFHKLDSWIRMRLRSMKYKRRCLEDNRKMRDKTFARLGLLTLESFCWPRSCPRMQSDSSHKAISVRKVRPRVDRGRRDRPET